MFGRIFCERIQLIISYYIHTFLLKEALYRRCNNNQIGWNILCVLFVVTHVSSVLWYSSYYIKYLFLLVYKKVLNFTSIIIVHIYSHTPYTFVWNILTFIHFFVNSIHKNLSIEYYYIFFLHLQHRSPPYYFPLFCNSFTYSGYTLDAFVTYTYALFVNYSKKLHWLATAIWHRGVFLIGL